jgi:hypothetical protein
MIYKTNLFFFSLIDKFPYRLIMDLDLLQENHLGP